MDWKAFDEANRKHRAEVIEQSMKGDAANRDFFGAVKFARGSIATEDLLPTRQTDEHGDSDIRYTAEQGIRAACNSREDIVTTLVLQRVLLMRLDRNYRLTWLVLLVAGYVAYRVS